MSTLSRRHLVTSAAALPALALPAIADPSGPNPDAELLRLGVELEAIIVEWRAQRAIDRKQSATIDAALEAAGLSVIDYQSLPDDELRAYLAKRDAVTHPIYRARGDVNEAGEEVDVWDDIHGRMWPMIQAVLERKAQTLAGFAVQARAITLSHAELWEDAIGHDEDHRPFLEAACAIAGVVPVPLDGAAEA